ncbi:hypothetical protein POUND7_018770 [Theobroma cacao]
MGRSPSCEKVGLKRGRWTAEEDEILTKYIQLNGEGSWKSLPKNADLKRGNFTAGEEETIVKLHSSLGNRWSSIAAELPGRTDNEIKNYWKTHLRRKIYSFTKKIHDGSTYGGCQNWRGRENQLHWTNEGQQHFERFAGRELGTHGCCMNNAALQSEFAVVDPSGDGCSDPKEENGGIMVMTEEMDSEIPESKSDDEERGSCSTWNSDCGRSSGELQVCRSSPWKLMV